MIVYFLKKSKKTYKKWGINLVAAFLIFYMLFTYNQMIRRVSTIQIIRVNTQKIEEKEKIDSLKDPPIKIGEYEYVASKKGKYYYPKNCGRAQALSVKNMLYFKDKFAASEAGYMPYSGCF